MARRRGVGIGAIQRKEKMQEKFKEKGSELASSQLERLRNELELFTVQLERFAEKHRDEVRRNPQFRIAFQEMCAASGVDPLASSRGTLSSLLGVGDFYYELAVQIVEVCMSTNHLNGGLMTLEELRQRLARSRKRTRREQISTEDMQRAIEKLSVLGNGFAIIPLGANRCLVQSVPAELSMDHTRVLQLADDTCYVTRELLLDRLQWDEQRVDAALEHLTGEGIAWVDGQCDDTPQYWLPSLFMQQYIETCPSSSDSQTSRQ